MTKLGWSLLILSVLLGLGAGLYYGWEISPVQYVDTTPASLRADFQADYTLMVAETFEKEQKPDEAARRLAILGGKTPVELVSAALEFGQQNKFSPADLSALQNLKAALEVWQPGISPTQPAASPSQPQPGQP